MALVVSLNIEGNAAGAVSAGKATRAEMATLGKELETTRAKARELDNAFASQAAARAKASSYADLVANLRAEQQLEASRLKAQITETGRNQSLARGAALARDAASAAQALANSERELASVQARVATAAAQAGLALDRLATQQGRVSASAQAQVNAQLGVRTDFGTGQREADIAAYGQQLDALRGKFNPLYAAGQAYKTTLREIRDAHRLGAISSQEMASAIDREKAAFAAQVTNMGAYGQQVRRTQFATANIAAQLQDIAVTGAMGMSPLQIALQQGTQLAAVLGPMGTTGVVKGLAAAFASVLSPVSLLTIGTIALGVAAGQWIFSLIPKVKTADEAIKTHADLVARIKESYDQALQGAENYARESPHLLAAMSRQSKAELEASLRATFEEFNNKSSVLFADADGVYRDNWRVREQFKPFEDAIQRLRQQMAAGKPDFDAFYASVNRTVAGNASLRKAGDELIRATTESNKLSRSLQQNGRDAANLANQALAAHGAFALLANDPLWQGTIAPLQASLENRIASDRSKEQFDLEMASIQARSPAQQAEIARKQKALELEGQSIDASLKRQEIEQAGALAYAQAAKGIGDAARSRLLAANQNIAAAQLELNLIGKNVEETERLRFVREQLASAEAEAASNGTAVSAAYRAEIEKLGDAYGRLKQKIAETQLASDLQFQFDQLGRSPTEQKVYEQLRPIYGDDVTSAQAQFFANQIRVNESLQQLYAIGRDVTGGFFSDLKSELLNGASLWDAFAQAGANALNKIADKALGFAADGIFDLIFNAFKPAMSSGGGLGGLISGLFGNNARGTDYWTGGYTWVGEEGPELMKLPGGTQILSNNRSMALASRAANNNAPTAANTNSTGAGGINIHYAPVISLDGSSAPAFDLERALQASRDQFYRDFPQLYADALRRAKI
ncbi:hypothetical protein [Devosia sp. DBB001]|nr:hypothetical protein [Devosia sp. DBB001]